MIGTDQSALLAAIREQPDDDTLRLAYADYLDGLDTESVKCPTCDAAWLEQTGVASVYEHAGPDSGWVACETCKGTGFIPDTSNADRAELIRVQVEYERYYTKPYPEPSLSQDTINNKLLPLSKRVGELIRAHADRWRKGPVCEKCEGKGSWEEKDYVPYGGRYKVTCKDCFGTGDAGGLGLRDTTHEWAPHKVDYVRGMKRVHCRAEEVWKQVEHIYKGAAPIVADVRWAPTPWARAVCTHHPDVAEFWMEPTHGNGWLRSCIPDDVWMSIQGHDSREEGQRRMGPVAVLWVHQHLTARPQ